MKIAIYSRKSKYTGKGDSIGNQIQMCKDYIETHYRNNDPEYIIYEDEGFSGGNINRPKFQKLLSDIKKEKSESYPDFAKRTEESVKVFDQGVFIKCVQIIESIEYGNHKVTESECIYFENALKTAQKRVTSYMGIMRRIIYRYFINRLGI